MLATALAVVASAAAAAAQDDGGRDMVGGAGTEATGISSIQDRSAGARFKLDALYINVYGLSYHPDRETAHRLHLDNEVNPGLGLHYELVNDARGITFAEAGAYRDSGENWAKFAGLGYQFKFGEHWRVGGAVAVVYSRTYNDGTAFIGMIPLITYDLGRVKLNAVYLPKIEHRNEVAAFGFYISIPLGQWAR